MNNSKYKSGPFLIHSLHMTFNKKSNLIECTFISKKSLTIMNEVCLAIAPFGQVFQVLVRLSSYCHGYNLNLILNYPAGQIKFLVVKQKQFLGKLYRDFSVSRVGYLAVLCPSVMYIITPPLVDESGGFNSFKGISQSEVIFIGKCTFM